MKTKKIPNSLIPIQDAQLTAIEGRLTNTLSSFERKIRRWFSKEHCTPYLDTFKFPWDELLLHYYESNLTHKTYNEVYDLAISSYLPEFIEESEIRDVEFNKRLLDEQSKALAAKKKKSKEQHQKASKAPGETNKSKKQQSLDKNLDDNQAKHPVPEKISLKFDSSLEDDIEPEKSGLE